MSDVRIEISDTEISLKEERLQIIADSKLNELCASVGLNIDLNTFQDYDYKDLKTDLVNFNSDGKYTLSNNSLDILTPKLEDKNFYKIQNTLISNPKAKIDDNIVTFFKNCPFKEDLVFKNYLSVNFADLLFDHILTVGMVPVLNSIILFRNYCFVLKPFLNSFEEETNFLKAFGDGIQKTAYPRYFIKDY